MNDQIEVICLFVAALVCFLAPQIFQAWAVKQYLKYLQKLPASERPLVTVQSLRRDVKGLSKKEARLSIYRLTCDGKLVWNELRGGYVFT